VAINGNRLKAAIEKAAPHMVGLVNGYYLRRTMGDPASSSMREVAANILPMVPSDRPVLDICCGSGAWLCELADRGYTDVHGIDIDRDGQVEVCRSVLAEMGLRAAVRKGDIWEPGDIGGPWGMITVFDALYDLTTPDPDRIGRMLRTLADRLEVGGFLAFDWYANEAEIKESRSYQSIGELEGLAPPELVPVLQFARVRGGRNISLHVFRKDRT